MAKSSFLVKNLLSVEKYSKAQLSCGLKRLFMRLNGVILLLVLILGSSTFAQVPLKPGVKTQSDQPVELPEIIVHAGSLNRDSKGFVDVAFVNTTNDVLEIQSIEKLSEESYAFRPFHLKQESILQGAYHHFQFYNGAVNEIKNLRNNSDRFRVYFQNSKKETFYCDVSIMYRIIEDISALVQVQSDSVFLGVNDTINTAVVIKNKGRQPVKITQINAPAGVHVQIGLPITLDGFATLSIPFEIVHSEDYHGEFNKNISFITDEPIRRPRFYANINGAIVGGYQPSIIFDNYTIICDTIPYAGDGQFSFWFTNTGESPLQIRLLLSSCGCLVPICSKKGPILPGERGEIVARYDTRRHGSFNKTVTVKSNAVEGDILLRIKGLVLPKP